VTDEKLAEVWVMEVSTLGKVEDQFTPSDWYAVQKSVQDKTAKF
jgi:hypothetical protein